MLQFIIVFGGFMNKLVVLWKTDNLIDIKEMVIPYLQNSISRKWWDEIEVIIWGVSQKIIADNFEIQLDVEAMIYDGIKISACKSCSDSLCVTNNLVDLGIDVIYTGELLTSRLQSDCKFITF